MAEVEEILNGILEKIRKEQDYENGETTVKPISTHGANYSSLLFYAKISKTAGTSEKMRKLTPYDIFETETFAYKELFKSYRELEDKHNVPPEHRLVTPKFYGCSEVYLKEALVLEDLTASGYETFDRFKCINWEYASRSVENIAKFHALSISCSIESPDIFHKIQAVKNAGGLIDFLEINIENVLKVTREENRDRLSKFVTKIIKNLNDLTYFQPIRRSVIAHGDYRPSNLMHRVNEDGTVDVISMDYQTLQQGNPIFDLLYFIFNGSDKQFRKKHFSQTLELYYTQLSAALQRLDLDPATIYSRNDFEYELQQVLPYGIISVFSLLIVTVEEADAPAVSKDIYVTDFAVKPSTLYAERLNDIVDDYIDMGIF